MTKRCPQCGEDKELTIENFTVRKRDNQTGEILAFAGWCRLCSRRKSRERRAQRTPEQLEADRRYHREMYALNRRDAAALERRKARQQIYRKSQKGRETSRAAARKAYHKMKADPERHAAYLELKRIRYHLKRLETGADQRFRKMSAVNGHREHLDVAELAQVVELIEEVRRRVKVFGWQETARRTGVAERVLRRYAGDGVGQNRFIEFESVDRLAMAFGVPLETIVADFAPLQKHLRRTVTTRTTVDPAEVGL